jgi:hypothetical protein
VCHEVAKFWVQIVGGVVVTLPRLAAVGDDHEATTRH